jgi:hypothetical protein
MKKLLPLTIALFAFCRLSAQSVPDGGFETWNTTNWSDPANYNTSNDQIFQGSKDPTANVTEVTGWENGVEGVQLTTATLDGSTQPGYITNSVNDPFMGIGGIPYNQKPTGLEIWYNCNIMSGDSGAFGVFFKQGGQLKASYLYYVTGTVTDYPILSETFTPALTFTPDTVIFAAISSVGFLEGRNTNFVGSTFTISGVTFLGSGITNPALLNGNFTSWTTESILTLPGWSTFSGASRTSDAYAGNYALELQTTPNGNNGAEPGYATTGDGNGHYLHAYTPVVNDTFEFYYKYTASVNKPDSGNCTIGFNTTGGQYLEGNLLPPSSGYQLVQFPVNPPNTPDSVFVNFFSWSSAMGGNPTLADVGSALEVDNVQFTSQKLANGIKPVLLADNTLLIYPNPAVTQFTIASAESFINEIRLQNIIGETVLDNQYSQGNATTRQMIDVSNLTPGLYFISITSGNKTSTGKIMVSR